MLHDTPLLVAAAAAAQQKCVLSKTPKFHNAGKIRNASSGVRAATLPWCTR